MKGLRRLCGAGILAVTLLLIGSSPAFAELGPEWSMNDPDFNIDGRVLHVTSFVPTAAAGAALHYVLTVNEDAQATWSLPPGESLNGGSVTIRKSDDVGRNSASLLVRAEGPNYQMWVTVSGPGLRGDPIEKLGSTSGTRVKIKLVSLADPDDDDD